MSPDTLFELLECAEELVFPAVCRSFWHPGPEAPHDVCSASVDAEGNEVNGQLWIGYIVEQPGWPEPTGEPMTCTTPFTVTLELGIVRCAQGIVDDDGNAPDADLITADAQQQYDDRIALRRAIMCCWTVEHKDIVLVDWTATPPQGGCVGGTWTVQLRDSTCACGPELS